MEHFLKDTVLGIIVLGAVGSILAATIIWGIRRTIQAITPKLYNMIISIVVSVMVFTIKPGVVKQAELYVEHNQNKTSAYYATQKAQMILSLFLVNWLIIWGIVRVKAEALEPSSFEAVFYLSCIFLLLFNAIRKYFCLLVPLIIDIESSAEDAINKLDPHMVDIYRKYRASKSK